MKAVQEDFDILCHLEQSFEGQGLGTVNGSIHLKITVLTAHTLNRLPEKSQWPNLTIYNLPVLII